MKKIILFLLLIVLSFPIFSQGQSPNSIKWMEINTKHAKFIFPKEITGEAQKAANLLDYLYSFETKTLNTNPKKVPVILYNQSTKSNGFAALRPRRSAWFSTPSQYASDLGTDDWFYTLGVHEFRHIVQYSKSNHHLTKFFSTIFGQTGLLMGEYSIPYWFFEGDAVTTETSLSKGGRGRIPQFDMPIRTMLLNDKKISYDKAKLGSYKTFVPGYYNLGYQLASQARVMYGEDVWDKTLNHTSKISFWPYAFSRGLKKASGLNEKKLYKKVMNHLDSTWKEELKNITITSAKIINTKKKKSWTKYTEVNYLNENQIIAKKTSLKSDITSFYIIDKDGKEEKLFATDAGMISVADNKIVWARKYYDPRWQVRDYSDLIIYDLKTKKEKRLTEKQKLFAPALSPDGKKIVAVQYDTEMKTKLIFFDIETGEQYKTISSPNNDFIRTPTWNDDASKIVFTRTNAKGTALSYIDMRTEIIYDILEYSDENIGRPIFYKNYIIYNSPYSGIGNIFAVNIKTKEKFQITSRKFGAYNPKISGNNLLFIDYSEKGYDIAEIVLNKESFKPIKKVKKYIFKTAENLKNQEAGKNTLNPDLIPTKVFELKKYNKLKQAINIHSWGFNVNPSTNFNADNFKPEIGFDIYSANILNTVFGVAGVKYDFQENTFGSSLSAIFKKYYPVYSITGGWAQRSLNYPDIGKDNWEEMRGTFSMTLPLNFSSGIYYKGANFRTSYSYIQRVNKDYRYFYESGNGNFSTIGYSGSIYAFRHQSTQDINPKFGYFLYANFQHTPFNTNIYGNQFSALASVYLPGVFKHHSLNIKAGYEQQRNDENFDITNYYWFSSSQSFPRGQTYSAFDKISNLSANYSFPVWYPDFNIGPIVYFKRLRANLFFDYANLNLLGGNYNQTLHSAGLEMFLQMYVFRLGEPIEIGGRVSYLQDGTIVPEFIMFSLPF